jgi:hypothetical protein
MAVGKVMAAQTFSSALEQLNKPECRIPGSSAAAHAFKIAKRTQFRTHLSVTYVLDRRREIATSVLFDFPNLTTSLDARSGTTPRHQFKLFTMSSARGSVQLPGFRYIGTPAHVVDIPFRSSSIAKSESIVGVKSNRLVVISDGSFVVAFIHVSVTPVLEGEGAFGIEPNCRVKIGDGSIIVAFVCI